MAKFSVGSVVVNLQSHLETTAMEIDDDRDFSLVDMPSPALHTVLELLGQDALTLVATSSSIKNLLEAPCLYWKRWSLSGLLSRARPIIIEEQGLLRLSILARHRRPSWDDNGSDVIPSVNAGSFLSGVELASRSHLTPWFFQQASENSCELAGLLTLALAAIFSPRLRPYASQKPFLDRIRPASLRLKYTSFGRLSNNVRGFRGRDVPNYVNLSTEEIVRVLQDRGGETTTLLNWDRVLKINSMARPMSCAAPEFIIAEVVGGC
mmetsp:Transcript_13423/g.26656  ORF Transcript_13423/g.26656 Transcript_13423/m.26656 type:complete len:265 (+) Transcript_13423:237-1031(+)